MIIEERSSEPSARDQCNRGCGIAQTILVLASVQNGLRTRREMVTNSFIKRVSSTNSGQGAAEIQPIFLVPPQGRGEIKLGVLERRIKKRVRGMADGGEYSGDSPSQYQPLHPHGGLDLPPVMRLTHWLPRAGETQGIHYGRTVKTTMRMKWLILGWAVAGI